VAWLYLLAYAIAALIVASFLYARWNRGVRGEIHVQSTLSPSGSPRDDLPEQVLRSAPTARAIFELDRIELKLGLVTERGTRGPAQMAGTVGATPASTASGVVPHAGWSERTIIGPLRRGPVLAAGWKLTTSDPLGLFSNRSSSTDRELALVLPRFTSLNRRVQVRELEASVAAPRTGSGTELFGVREYRPGDPLRRIHWRSSARHGELIVREFEPPGIQMLGIVCDPAPPSPDAADQIARLAASEAWDCIRSGGRVVLWAPGVEPTHRSEERNIWALLEWLARYPAVDEDATPSRPPLMRDAVAVIATADARLVDALETVKAQGGSVRGWVVGDAQPEIDAPTQQVGLGWPV